MRHERAGLTLWPSRLILFAVWTIFVLVWRRGRHFGLSIEALEEELPDLAALVLVPGAVLLLGAPPKLYAAGLLSVLLVGSILAEAIASEQELAFVAHCRSTVGPTIIEQKRFTIISGPRMVFLRSTDGHEAFHGYD